MIGYRLFLLDPLGHIASAIEIPVDTDAEALEAAQQYRDGKDMELWTGSRCVAHIPKKSPDES